LDWADLPDYVQDMASRVPYLGPPFCLAQASGICVFATCPDDTYGYHGEIDLYAYDNACNETGSLLGVALPMYGMELDSQLPMAIVTTQEDTYSLPKMTYAGKDYGSTVHCWDAGTWTYFRFYKSACYMTFPC
jgi:hypothetical protein